MAYCALSLFLLLGFLEILSLGVYSISSLFLLLHIGERVMRGEAASCLPNESLALLQFKQSLLSHGSEPLLSTWKNGSDCCQWEGVSCDHITGLVTGLAIYGRAVGVSDPNSSLFELHHLQRLSLSNNLVSGAVVSRLSELTNLTELWLSDCRLTGPIPESFQQLSNLTFLDLSHNRLSGEIPPGMLKHPNLRLLYLAYNKLNGSFPDFGNEFSPLTVVDLSYNMLDGEIPSSTVRKLPHLEYLDIEGNGFSGPIPESFQQLSNLTFLNLSHNGLSGEIPPGMLKHPNLRSLDLAHNKLNGSFPDFGNEFSPLTVVDLSYNMLDGEIPSSIVRKLPHLEQLDIEGNRLSGIIHLFLFQNLRNLSYLDLSYNHLIVEFPKAVDLNHEATIFPRLRELGLGFCNIKEEFPWFIQNMKGLEHLDLSHNNISGKVPLWVWGLPILGYLHISNNKFDGFEEAANINGSENLDIQLGFMVDLDMSNNNIKGTIPSALFCNMFNLTILDLSGNNLTGTIPNCLTNFTRLLFLDLSKNQLQGQIPRGLICHSECALGVLLGDNQFTGEITRLLFNCSLNSLMLLDLSNNKLTGRLPDDLFTNFYLIVVLDLSKNQLHGPIPEEFSSTPFLQVFNLNGNKLVGRIPRFLSKCSQLKVINLGNNELSDVFPYWLGHLDNLSVLVLHSNKLHGTISSPFSMHLFSSLSILDISGNQFEGHLPSGLFQNFSSMMMKQANVYSHGLTYVTYQEELVLTIKGQSQVWNQILILTSIDLSNNLFTGTIPEDISALHRLYTLNLSWNNLDGPIPRSFGQLQSMESLDLSHNHLSGSIPEELTRDTFLSVLDLSCNNLQGRIPLGKQFGTFNATSFDGNPGLCGPPLPISCPSTNGGPQDSINHVKEMAGDPHWEYLAAGIGYAVGFLTIILPILFIQKVGSWFCVHVDRAFEACIDILTLSSTFCRA